MVTLEADAVVILGMRSDTGTATPGVSVVCVTHNKGELLRNTLREVVAQLGPSDEVIVLDDGGFDRGVVEACRATTSGSLMYVAVPHDGYRLATLCNVGVLRAAHDIVVKIDGDVLPTDGWLAALRSEVEPGRLVAGRIEWLGPDGSVRPDSRFDYAERRGSNGFRKVYGGNVAFAREDFLELGGFASAYDGIWGAEDADLGAKFALTGRRVSFSFSAAVVHQWHPPSPHRREVAKNRQLLRKRCASYKRGRVAERLLPSVLHRVGDQPTSQIADSDLVLLSGSAPTGGDIEDAMAGLLWSDDRVDAVLVDPADVEGPGGYVPWLTWSSDARPRTNDTVLVRARALRRSGFRTTATPSDVLAHARTLVRIALSRPDGVAHACP